jgi:hypothetical protein
LDMGIQRRDMGPQYFSDVGVEGVVGEEVLGTRGQERDLRVQQRRVERRDAVPLTRRPPPSQPMSESQPAQRIQRSGKHVDTLQVDAARLLGRR